MLMVLLFNGYLCLEIGILQNRVLDELVREPVDSARFLHFATFAIGGGGGAGVPPGALRK